MNRYEQWLVEHPEYAPPAVPEEARAVYGRWGDSNSSAITMTLLNDLFRQQYSVRSLENVFRGPALTYQNIVANAERATTRHQSYSVVYDTAETAPEPPAAAATTAPARVPRRTAPPNPVVPPRRNRR